jgi:hypothetical protein
MPAEVLRFASLQQASQKLFQETTYESNCNSDGTLRSRFSCGLSNGAEIIREIGRLGQSF